MPPIVIAAAITAGGALAGSAIASSGAKSAAETQAEAGREALDLQREIFALQRSDLAPWRASGTVALNEIMAMAGLGGIPNEMLSAFGAGAPGSSTAQAPPPPNTLDLPNPEGGTVERFVGGDGKTYYRAADGTIIPGSGEGSGGGLASVIAQMFAAQDAQFQQEWATNNPQGAGGDGSTFPEFQSGSLNADGVYEFKPTDPSYNFRFDEGARAVERGAGARGDALGGRAAKELLLYGQGAASQEFGNQFNRLAAIAGIGQAATSQGVSVAGQSGSAQADLLTSIGAARGSGQAASGQIWGQGITNTAGQIGQLFMLNDIMNQANTAPATTALPFTGAR